MNGMLRTIDDKIDRIKHTGTADLPRENLLSNLPVIESIIFETKPYSLEWANDGGCRTYDS